MLKNLNYKFPKINLFLFLFSSFCISLIILNTSPEYALNILIFCMFLFVATYNLTKIFINKRNIPLSISTFLVFLTILKYLQIDTFINISLLLISIVTINIFWKQIKRQTFQKNNCKNIK